MLAARDEEPRAAAHRPGDRSHDERPLLDPRAMLSSIGVAVYDWDLASDHIAWGRNAAEVLGLADMAGRCTGDHLGAGSDPDRTGALRDLIARARTHDGGSGVPYCLTYRLGAGGRDARTIEESGRWFADRDGRPAFAHGMIRLVPTPAAAATKGSRERSAFLVKLGQDVTATLRQKGQIGMVVAAIDNLAGLNDEFGFDTADLVLDEICRRLNGTMRRRDAFARYSGNRFAMALRGCPLDQVRTAIDRVSVAAMAEPITIGGQDIRPRLLFGAATAPAHATDAAGLLRCAEQALVAAKRGDSGALVIYDPERARRDRRQQAARSPLDVLGLLNDRRIAIACQPVVEAASRHLAFGEALLRVRGPDGVLQNAADVIPIVERAGLISLVDIRVLELAAEHLVRHPGTKLSVNVSPASLEGPDWCAALAANLGTQSDLASRLIVEITETVAVRDPEAIRRRLDTVKALGVAIAIDDFGAGHTSFRHLRNFPVDLVKMDGAFAQNLASAHDDRFFVRTLIDLAHHVGLPIVAEWVEDEATAALLTGWGVDFLQGDHCGRPVLADLYGAGPGAPARIEGCRVA